MATAYNDNQSNLQMKSALEYKSSSKTGKLEQGIRKGLISRFLKETTI